MAIAVSSSTISTRAGPSRSLAGSGSLCCLERREVRAMSALRERRAQRHMDGLLQIGENGLLAGDDLAGRGHAGQDRVALGIVADIAVVERDAGAVVALARPVDEGTGRDEGERAG